MYAQFRQQLSAAARALGVDVSGVGRSKSGVILLDGQELRLFVGSGAPRQVASFPAQLIRGIQIADVPQGNWILNSLEFELSKDGETFAPDCCVTRKAWVGVLPNRMLEKQLTVALAQLPSLHV